MPIAGPRPIRPRRSIHATSGSSASARKSAITTQASTCRAIQITSSRIATPIAIRRTRRIVRGRSSTTRSTAVGSVDTPGASPRHRTLYGLAMSLRGVPVIEHATLPGGGTVTVWVGVPDDPYIEDKTQLTTVDIQLHEGNAVVASLTTVLEPDQTSQAADLARE